jgi:hypothetical protein
MDWFELYQFGNLASGPEDDSDGDGFSNKREGELGQEATIAEFTEPGGIAGRMSNSFNYADTSMVLVTITSNPKGFITESVTYDDYNATVTTQNLHGSTNGSHFAYWTINGVRQFGPTGVSQSQVSAVITANTVFTAHYIPSTEDTDSDGVMDWFEMYQFGSLSLGPSDDPDGDGFSNKREGELGQEATIGEFTEAGGIAGRMSNSIVYYNQDWMRMILWSPSRLCPMAMALLKFRYPSLHPMILRYSSMDSVMEIHRRLPRGNIISIGMHRLGDLIASMSIAI